MNSKTQKKKRLSLQSLEGYIQVEVSIECTKCETGGYLSDFNSEEDAYKQGWRATENHCYCPKCAKKYLKK